MHSHKCNFVLLSLRRIDLNNVNTFIDIEMDGVWTREKSTGIETVCTTLTPSEVPLNIKNNLYYGLVT